MLLQEALRDLLAQIKVIPFEVSVSASPEQENPWTEFVGMYAGDADFAAISAKLRAERELDELGKI